MASHGDLPYAGGIAGFPRFSSAGVLKDGLQRIESRRELYHHQISGGTGEMASDSSCLHWSQLCRIVEADKGSEIYREGNQRYVVVKYSVRAATSAAQSNKPFEKVNRQVKLLGGYHIDWEGSIKPRSEPTSGCSPSCRLQSQSSS